MPFVYGGQDSNESCQVEAGFLSGSFPRGSPLSCELLLGVVRLNRRI